MSLPFSFLDNKEKSFGTVGSVDMSEESMDPGVMAAAFDLLKAVEAKDTKAIAQALKNAFELLDSQPHREGLHVP